MLLVINGIICHQRDYLVNCAVFTFSSTSREAFQDCERPRKASLDVNKNFLKRNSMVEWTRKGQAKALASLPRFLDHSEYIKACRNKPVQRIFTVQDFSTITSNKITRPFSVQAIANTHARLKQQSLCPPQGPAVTRREHVPPSEKDQPFEATAAVVLVSRRRGRFTQLVHQIQTPAHLCVLRGAAQTLFLRPFCIHSAAGSAGPALNWVRGGR